MNEFIVWDEEDKCFIDNFVFDEYLPLNELLKGDEIFKLFPYIGKKDINGKKIYADSSIVEFMLTRESQIGSMSNEFKTKKRGFISFNVEKSSCEIKTLGDFKDIYNFIENEICDLKIIDTIQQNKLGLIK